MTISAPPPGGFAGRPGHTIALDPLGKPVAVAVDGIELARSDDAIVMREDDYPAIIYIPAACIRFGRLTRTGSSAHCPFKGDASYWRVADGNAGPDVMWSYETPYDEMEETGGYGAFYGDRVKIEVG